MKALLYHGPWSMSLEDLPKPELKNGNVFIKMESVGIRGSDVHGFTGESRRRTPGMVMGHEAVGNVVDQAGDVGSPGMVMGHEAVGNVVDQAGDVGSPEVGSRVHRLLYPADAPTYQASN